MVELVAEGLDNRIPVASLRELAVASEPLAGEFLKRLLQGWSSRKVLLEEPDRAAPILFMTQHKRVSPFRRGNAQLAATTADVNCRRITQSLRRGNHPCRNVAAGQLS